MVREKHLGERAARMRQALVAATPNESFRRSVASAEHDGAGQEAAPRAGRTTSRSPCCAGRSRTSPRSWSPARRSLLYIYADLDGDGTAERYPLFDDSLQDYFWQYDNQGLHLAQLRFYELVTDVNQAARRRRGGRRPGWPA